MKPIWIRMILFVTLVGYSPGFSQSVNLPMEHWIYPFIELLETKGLYDEIGFRSFPLSRQEIAKILSQADRMVKEKHISLTMTEMAQLEQFKGEFHEELENLKLHADPSYHERHLFSWSQANNKIHADFDFGFDLDVRKGDRTPATEATTHTTLGGILRGKLKESLGFHVFVRNTIHRGTDITQENYDPSQGLPISLSGKNVYTDEAIAYLVWKLPWFRLEVGRNRAKWGPGYRGSLMLSMQNPLFDMIKLKLKVKRFQFTSIHGSLNSSVGSKYFAAHRLEIKLFSWLYLAGSESVVYGNRGIEFQYLNPIMPYHVAEHHLGDRDNNMIGFDISAFPLKNVKLYFELFLDDYSLSKNPFTYFGNKFAFLIGGYWVEPLGIENVDLHTEYARIEPYVYTHYDPINVYQNYDQSIGHWLGPNADHLFMELNFRPSRDLKLTLTLDKVRNGTGSITEPWNASLGMKKEFLSGVVEELTDYGVHLSHQMFRDFFVRLKANWMLTKQFNLVENEDVSDFRVHLQLLLNY